MTKTIEGDFSAATGRFSIIVSRFNGFIVESLLAGAIDTLHRHGVADDNITVVRVPGAFELPVAAQKIARKGNVDAIITLGAVIRGATPHFDYVCRGVTDGVREVMRDLDVPVGFGVLTTDNIDQALSRAGGSDGNKGGEVALAAVEMAQLKSRSKLGGASQHG